MVNCGTAHKSLYPCANGCCWPYNFSDRRREVYIVIPTSTGIRTLWELESNISNEIVNLFSAFRRSGQRDLRRLILTFELLAKTLTS